MSSAVGSSESTSDPLRRQIETALHEEFRRRRASTRRWVVIGILALALAFSIALNVLVFTAPGVLGIASENQIAAVRQDVATVQNAQVVDSALVSAFGARVDQVVGRAAAVPAICDTLKALGKWSYLIGEAPPHVCPPGVR